MSDETKARALLAAQFVALGALVLPRGGKRAPRKPLLRRAGWLLVISGGALAAAGALTLGPDLRPLPLPREGASLQTTGPYRYARHPIYAGLLISAAGRALATGSRRHVGASLALAAVFHFKVELEEKLLEDVVAYGDYRAQVLRWGIGK